MDTNGNGKKGLKFRRPRDDSEGTDGMDRKDLDFIYEDCDSQVNEIAELYSYTEHPEFQLNVKSFEECMEDFLHPPCWQKLNKLQQENVILKLLDHLEYADSVKRMRAARCILYLAQGCWAEMQSDAELFYWTRLNVMLLYKMGVFSAFIDLLNLEIERSNAAIALRKLAESLADSTNLRVILSVLYIITEIMRTEREDQSSDYSDLVQNFKDDLGTPYGDELLSVKLLGMVTHLCAGTTPHFPMKKVLLLLWKVLLVYLGGSDTLKELKSQYRKKHDLSEICEDTTEITKNMRASSPPPSAADLLESQNPKRNNRPFKRQNFIKQKSFNEYDPEQMFLDKDDTGNGSEDYLSEFDDNNTFESSPNSYSGQSSMYLQGPPSPVPPPPTPRGLPWLPKVRQKDIDNFLNMARIKFVGYALPDDRQTLAGLPQPIHEGVNILKQHMYVSLSELQIEKEIEISHNPLTRTEGEIDETEAEVLYRAIVPNLPQYMIALLKILLAAAPTSKAQTYSVNIMADVLPEEMPMTVLQSMKLGVDVNRHKEIIVKAVSAILLLLLKHFKLNHIYQFEFMSQHLVFANCIPLVLKFFNQNNDITSYVGAKNCIPIFDFPACVIGEQPELTKESLDIGDSSLPYSWRNLFSCINLLRILNKLTKWKHSRIMMLVVFKSAPILKRTLKVRHAMMQLYVLKLLKMQTKYLGRQWRKSNMKTISAIYSKVRHRLNDDWAFGNDMDARPWDYQAEESSLRGCVDRFNQRRYGSGPNNDSMEYDFMPLDCNTNSVLGINLDLGEEFKSNYELWLEHEVYNSDIDWDVLLHI